MFGEYSALAALVHVVAPMTVATFLAISFRRGGPSRLWRDAVILSAAVGLFALWQGRITIYRGPRGGSGIDSWPWFPAAVVVSAVVVQALGFRVVPTLVRIGAATLAEMVVLLAGSWIA